MNVYAVDYVTMGYPKWFYEWLARIVGKNQLTLEMGGKVTADSEYYYSNVDLRTINTNGINTIEEHLLDIAYYSASITAGLADAVYDVAGHTHQDLDRLNVVCLE